MAKTWIYVVVTTIYEAGDRLLKEPTIELFETEQDACEALNKKADAMHDEIYDEADEDTIDGISEERTSREYTISREPDTEYEYQGHISIECCAVGKDEEEFVPFCKNFIIENLDDREGQSHYGCDLGGYLTDAMNCDGTFTYSTNKAKQLLQAWWWDAEQYSEYEDLNFGQRTNPFKNIEAYLVRMVSEGVNALLSKCDIIDQYWNDELELTADTIATIKEQVEEIDDDEELF